MSHVLNFNAGPAMLPPTVLDQVQAELKDYQRRGMSLMEMSHRSKEYEAVNMAAEAGILRLLGLGEGYRVIFVQGGASGQFSTLPSNFLPPGGSADYIVTGVWGEKAIEEAAKLGKARLAGSTKSSNYTRVPTPGELDLDLDPTAAYLHYTTNETIQGVQWKGVPDASGVPLVADMSSDILSGPIDASKFALIYAGAQKNLGPAGVTVVILRESWLAKANPAVPTMLKYATHVKNNSLYNTPPTFGVYILSLVVAWVESHGGLTPMAARNEAKAKSIYDAIDSSGGFYKGHADLGSRSTMNVTFRLASEPLEKAFLAEAQAAGMVGLPGHRSVGGVRASIYNAMSPEGCATLATFMNDFARKNG